MKIYDISQEVFSSTVYKGDPSPKGKLEKDMEKGDLYNLTTFSMCAHNGTHIDAPRHFYKNGKGVDGIDLTKCVGQAVVIEASGILEAVEVLKLLEKAKNISPGGYKRLLLKGDVIISKEGAEVLSAEDIFLLGVESQSCAKVEETMVTHKILLGKEIVLLEGIRLEAVTEGEYFLNAAPLNLKGADGAPVRAILIEN